MSTIQFIYLCTVTDRYAFQLPQSSSNNSSEPVPSSHTESHLSKRHNAKQDFTDKEPYPRGVGRKVRWTKIRLEGDPGGCRY